MKLASLSDYLSLAVPLRTAHYIMTCVSVKRCRETWTRDRSISLAPPHIDTVTVGAWVGNYELSLYFENLAEKPNENNP